MKKMKNILGEAFEDTPKVNKHKVVEGVRNYGIVGKALYNNNNIMEIAKQLSEVAESAHSHILGEQDDWFDKISVNRNMKSLKGNVMEFQKTAKEAHALNQRLTGLYEDIGHVLNRYYEISEDLDPVGKEDDDVDNDGDSDASDKYLKKKRAAVTKAVKNETENKFQKQVNEAFEGLQNVVTEKRTVKEAAPKMKPSPFVKKVYEVVKDFEKVEGQMKYKDNSGYSHVKKQFSKVTREFQTLMMDIRRHGSNL